jgi:ABC-type nitrate/sulfonate/bicarbonate transport system permease component
MPRRRAGLRAIAVLAVQVLMVAGLVVIWALASRRLGVRLLVSTPGAVISWWWEWAQGRRVNGLEDLRVTLYEALLGYLLGIVLGVAGAVLMSASWWVRQVLAPLAAIANALPKIAMAPLFILVFGATLPGKVYFVTAGVVFIAFFSVYSGLRSIDRIYIDHVRALGAGRLWLIREVYAPATVGWLATSLRLMAAWSLASAVIAEYISSSSGMGYVIAFGQQLIKPEQVIAGILTIAAVAMAADRVIVQVERRFRGWRLA